MLNVLRCQLTYWGQVVTNAEARFSNSLCPQKPEGLLGRTAQDGHLDSHTAPELSTCNRVIHLYMYCGETTCNSYTFIYMYCGETTCNRAIHLYVLW